MAVISLSGTLQGDSLPIVVVKSGFRYPFNSTGVDAFKSVDSPLTITELSISPARTAAVTYSVTGALRSKNNSGMLNNQHRNEQSDSLAN